MIVGLRPLTFFFYNRLIMGLLHHESGEIRLHKICRLILILCVHIRWFLFFSPIDCDILARVISLTVSQTTNFRLFQTETDCRWQFQIWPIWQRALQTLWEKTLWWKTMWEKEKLLVRSNSSFSHSVFKRLELQTRKNQGLFGKGLTPVTGARDNKEYLLNKEKLLFLMI